ncbi:MAG: uridine kinase [Candidatus Omnitrophota bacterium]
MEKKKPGVKLIAIAGPSASGKTLLAEKLVQKLGRKNAVILSQDRYYKDLSRMPLRKRGCINFDEPKAFDFVLMKKQIKDLCNGKRIRAPRYSFRLHKRLSKRTIIPNSSDLFSMSYIIVEGILVYYPGDLRDLFDLKVYVDIDEATALARRIRRDVAHRSETIELVCERFFRDVLPMQKRYIEIQKKEADVVINEKDQISKSIDILYKIVKDPGKV